MCRLHQLTSEKVKSYRKSTLKTIYIPGRWSRKQDESLFFVKVHRVVLAIDLKMPKERLLLLLDVRRHCGIHI